MARINITETREQLHELIDSVDDAEVLEVYLELLSSYSKQATFEPTTDEVKAINEGLASIKNKGTLSHEEAVARLRVKYPNIIL